MAIDYERPEDDYYATPQWAIEGLFDIIQFPAMFDCGWVFGEPCKGDASAIYQHFPDNSKRYFADLNSGIDYFDVDWESAVDCIITNPPFNLAEEFLHKSLQEAPVVIYLLRLGFLASYGRHELLKRYNPDHMIILSDRPSFANGKTDNSEYAWLIFDEGNRIGLDKPFYFITDPSKVKRKKKKIKNKFTYTT